MGACAVLGISNQDLLSEDLENDPFLNSALQRFTCELYYRFGSFLSPLSIGIIMSRHYLSECNKNGGTSGMEGVEVLEHPETAGRTSPAEMNKNLWGRAVTPGPQSLGTCSTEGPSTLSKCEGPGGPATAGQGAASGVIGSFIGMGMVGFCFGIGLILAVKTEQSGVLY